MVVVRLSDASSRRSLDRQVAELHRIDSLILDAVKTGANLPIPARTFDVLSNASSAAADAIERCGTAPLPATVHIELLRLHCAIADLAATLKLYGASKRDNSRW
jgi:hypothetical protein